MKKISIIAIIAVLLLVFASCGNAEISGKIEYSEKACDKEFGIEADAPILVRCVEMVQSYKDEKGERLVLSNKKLESGSEIQNPDFPEDIKEAVFYGELKISGRDVVLSEEAVKAITFGEKTTKHALLELPANAGNAFGLVLKDGAYVSASDEWKIGEIRVSYYYISGEDIVSLPESYLK